MAHINGEFRHDYHDIVIEVLQPTRGECDYGEGLKIQVDWEHFNSLSLEEFRKVVQWFNRMSDYIELNFDKDGKPIRRKVITKHSDMAKTLREMEFTKKMYDGE
jgi:hypothetical protein